MILAIALLAFQAAAPAAQEPDPCDYITQNVWDPKFTPGQRWTYHADPSHSNSTVTIAEIDDVPGIGLVVHVTIDLIDSKTPPGIPPSHGTDHFAIKRDSLDASVIDLVGNVRIPELGYSYSSFRSHCAAQSYATTVSDTLAARDLERCERALQNNPRHTAQGCKSPAGLGPPLPAPKTMSSPSPSSPPALAPAASSPPAPSAPPPGA
jgi:hypothetical protein